MYPSMEDQMLKLAWYRILHNIKHVPQSHKRLYICFKPCNIYPYSTRNVLMPKSVPMWRLDLVNMFLVSKRYWKIFGTTNIKVQVKKEEEQHLPCLNRLSRLHCSSAGHNAWLP